MVSKQTDRPMSEYRCGEKLMSTRILLFEMKDRLYDVWARTHTLGGGGPKRLVTTGRMTYWGGTKRVWGGAKLQKVAKRLAFRV